jgi:hypothetical protein
MNLGQNGLYIPRSKLIPAEFRHDVERIVRYFEPYDAYVLNAEAEGETQRQRVMLIQASGVFTSWVFDVAARMINTLVGAVTKLERTNAFRNIPFEQHSRQLEKLEVAVREISEVLRTHQRMLATTLLNEVLASASGRALEKVLTDFGPEQGFGMVHETIKQAQLPYTSAVLHDWYMFAYEVGLGKSKRYRHPFTSGEIHTLLKDVEFCVTTGDQRPMHVFPLHVPSLQDMYVEVFIPEDLDPLLLACFRVKALSNLDFQLEWCLSRVTGQLVLQGNRYGSLRRCFEYWKLSGVADEFLAFSYACLLEEYLAGSLTEDLYLKRTVLDAGEEETIVGEQEGERGVDGVIDPSTEQMIVSSLPDTPTQAQKNDVLSSVRSQMYLSGALSLRKIVSTLIRCGVQVSFGGKHMKLEYKGRTSPFLNPHHGGASRKHRYILLSTLKTLGIPREEFINHL